MRTKHSLKCAICVLLSVLMAFSVMVFASAAEDADIAQTGAGETVYFKNTANWSIVKVYVWTGSNNEYTGWPGEEATLVKDNVYKYVIPGNYDKVIFNNGGNGAQTDDLTVPGDGYIFDFSTLKWSEYPDHVPAPTTATQPTTAPDPTSAPDPSQTQMVYCKNSAGWDSVCCYMWTENAGNNGGWPGKQMTNIGDDIWQYEVTGDWKMVIFNNGSSNAQTGNLTFPGNGHIYDNKTNTWDVFDLSPITVKSTAADLKSPQYVGTDITLTTEASSTEGAVSYKISVTNASAQTTVLSDFSAKNSVLWTPSAVGTYTITFDYKDAAGNTNQRTMSYEVTSDAGVAAPIIKGISPKPSEILNGKAQTFTVNASGGNVETNLLFYKFVVKNSNSEINNVPYYTKNATYSFTPTTTGIYSLTVSVQNAKNATVERTYVYTSVGSLTPTEPTTPTPTTPTPTAESTAPTSASSTTPGAYLKGDADSDGGVTVVDATVIQRFIAQIITELNFENADVDGDNDITVLDATKIQRYLAQLEENW